MPGLDKGCIQTTKLRSAATGCGGFLWAALREGEEEGQDDLHHLPVNSVQDKTTN